MQLYAILLKKCELHNIHTLRCYICRRFLHSVVLTKFTNMRIIAKQFLLVSLFIIASLNILYAANYYPNGNGNFENLGTWNGGATYPNSTNDDITYSYSPAVPATNTITLNSNVIMGDIDLQSGGNTVSVDFAGNSYSLTTNSVTLKDGATLIVDLNTFNILGDVTLSDGNLTIKAGTSVTIGGNLSISNSSIITVEGGATLTITGTTTTNGGTFNVETGGEITFNNDLSLAGSGATINIAENALFDINADFKFTGGANTINVDGKLDANSLTASGGAQELKIGTTGVVRVFGDSKFSGSATFDVQDEGYFRVGGNLKVSGGASGTVQSGANLLVGGTISGGNLITNLGGDIQSEIGASSALPIELTYFKALHTENSVTIYWQTATEEKNDYFTIERSKDGINFEIIATVKGAGYSYMPLNYSYTDNRALQGISYYRLTQTDYDGAYETFNPVSVSFINENTLKIGPNPTQNYINIGIGGELGKSIISLYSLSGALVKTVELQNNYTQIDISEISNGAYILKLNAGKTNITKRIIKE